VPAHLFANRAPIKINLGNPLAKHVQVANTKIAPRNLCAIHVQVVLTVLSVLQVVRILQLLVLSVHLQMGQHHAMFVVPEDTTMKLVSLSVKIAPKENTGTREITMFLYLYSREH